MLEWVNNIIKYFLNDPSTPDLVLDVKIPQKTPGADLTVIGFNGQNGVESNCYVTLTNSLNYAKANLGNKLIKWSSRNPLVVYPKAGADWNAFYDRMSLKFFYATDTVTKNVIYTANSVDVCAHELGHAILDAIRPDLWNLQAMEIWSFHESFGDINAILHSLLHEETINYILKETNGDLRKSNVISKLAEEMGTGLYHATQGKKSNMGYLRDAVNDFVYIKPEILPGNGPDNILFNEPHSFSRLFTGAWYDILVGIYEIEKKTKDAKSALIVARDRMAFYIFGAITQVPATTRFFNALAKVILLIEKNHGNVYYSLIEEVFSKRNMILAEGLSLSAGPDLWAICSMVNEKDKINVNQDGISVLIKNPVSIKLADYAVAPEDPLMNVALEVAADDFHAFGFGGRCMYSMFSNIEDHIESAKNCVDFLKNKNLISENGLFKVEENRLVRNYFLCGDGVINNHLDPNAPEFGKGWKSENNSGCGPHKPKDVPVIPRIKRGCFLKQNAGRVFTYNTGRCSGKATVC